MKKQSVTFKKPPINASIKRSSQQQQSKHQSTLQDEQSYFGNMYPEQDYNEPEEPVEPKPNPKQALVIISPLAIFIVCRLCGER